MFILYQLYRISRNIRFSEMQDSKHIHDSEDELPKQEKDLYPVKKSSSFDQSKLMRTPEAEPREFVYVYNYSENRTRRMKKREFLEKLGMLFNPSISSPHSTRWRHAYSITRSRNFTDDSTGNQNYDQAKIPYSIGSIPICTGNDGFGGGETVVARVHVNTALRLQRWLGVQKRLYIVDAIKL